MAGARGAQALRAASCCWKAALLLLALARPAATQQLQWTKPGADIYGPSPRSYANVIGECGCTLCMHAPQASPMHTPVRTTQVLFSHQLRAQLSVAMLVTGGSNATTGGTQLYLYGGWSQADSTWQDALLALSLDTPGGASWQQLPYSTASREWCCTALHRARLQVP